MTPPNRVQILVLTFRHMCAQFRAFTSLLQSWHALVFIRLNMDPGASSPSHLGPVLCIYNLNHGFRCHLLLCLITSSNVTTHCRCNPVEPNTLLLIPPSQTYQCPELLLQPGVTGGVKPSLTKET